MLERLARLGYASKAVIYGIVSVLATLTVMNRGGSITDTSGALRVALSQPFGRTLLVVLAVGLCGYGVWRWLDAIADPDHEGTNVSGISERIGKAVRGTIYGAMGLEAVRLLRGIRRQTGDQAELWTARLIAFPFGEVAVGIAGAIAAVYGASTFMHAIRGKHDKNIDWSCIRSDVRPLVHAVSRFGVAVRGALIATLGASLVRAALTRNPDAAAGPRESILQLGGVMEGRWFLALIALGLMAYAVDQAVHACCRRIRPVL